MKENFDIKSKDWDNNKRREKMNKNILNYLNKNINLNNKNILMDYGCGTGNIGINFYNKVSKLIFMDTSEGMLDVLKNKLNQLKINNFEIIKGDITENNENIPNLDIVISSMVFHHIDNIDDTINKIYNKLNPNGKIVLIDLDIEDGSFHSGEFNGHKGFEREYIENIFKQNHFKNIKIEDLYHMEKIVDNGEIKSFSIFCAIGEK